MNSHCKALLNKLEQEGLDSILITSQVNYRYLSGFTGTNATLLIHAAGCVLITDFRYTLQAQGQTMGQFEIVEAARGQTVMELIRQLQRFGCKKTGFEDQSVTYAAYQELAQLPTELVPASKLVSDLRMVKDSFELCAIRFAQQASDAAFGQLLELIHPGMTEVDVATELEYLLKKNGAECCSFDIIVGSGENGALCHAVPGSRTLAYGDMVVLDFGSKVGGYCSDMTRTIAIGEPDRKLQQIYEVVLDAQLRTLDALHPGITGQELDAVARDFIAEAGFGDRFGHGLGHGFGLEIHEAPTANSLSKDVLLPGMTITVEPGIYLEGLGGVRIEDCCVITKDGYENFVSAPKQLIIIE